MLAGFWGAKCRPRVVAIQGAIIKHVACPHMCAYVKIRNIISQGFCFLSIPKKLCCSESLGEILRGKNTLVKGKVIARFLKK